jgi:hypothetical protein
MNDDKVKWMEDVFQSMKGSQRAKPQSDVFVKIQNRIGFGDAKIVPLRQGRYAAAVAVLMLVVNTTALVYFNQQHQVNYEDVADGNTYNQALISTYQIY